MKHETLTKLHNQKYNNKLYIIDTFKLFYKFIKYIENKSKKNKY